MSEGKGDQSNVRVKDTLSVAHLKNPEPTQQRNGTYHWVSCVFGFFQLWFHFGVAPILEPILVGIGMFTGG